MSPAAELPDALRVAVEPEIPKPDPRYVLRYGAVRDGRVFGRVPAAAASGSAGLRGAGSFNAAVPPSDAAGKIYRACPPGKGMWVLCWDDGDNHRVIDAGTLWTRSAPDSGLSLGGAGFHNLLNRRLLVPNVAASAIATASPISFTGLDHGSIMRGIVALITSLPNGDLPVVLETSRAGTRQQTYNGFDLAYAGQRLTELSNQEPNTDFLWLPRFTPGSTQFVQFQLLTGTESAPQLSSVVEWRLNSTAPNQNVVGEVTVDDSADDTSTTEFGNGQGASGAAVIRSATDASLTDGGWPRLDGVTDSDSADGAQVQRVADGGLARKRRPLRGVKVQVKASWWWGQNRRLGDRVWLTHRHAYLGLLDVHSRVLEVAWDIASPWVVLTLADTLAEDGV